MFYWPKPHRLQFALSRTAAADGCEIVEASIAAVDKCWRGSMPGEYVPHPRSYQDERIDQQAREVLLERPEKVEIPRVMMLGNSHLSFVTGAFTFCLLREMADLGYVESMPFALSPWDAEKFAYYFRAKHAAGWQDVPIASVPYGERPTVQLYCPT